MARILSLPTGTGRMLDVRIKGSKYIVSLDGTELNIFKLKGVSNWFGAYDDFPLEIDGEMYILAVRAKIVRLAAGGKYTDNGEKFIPRQPLPGWFWVFGVLSILIPFATLGGLLPIMLAILSGTLCAHVVRGKLAVPVKILLCFVITGAAWAVAIAVVGAYIFMM